jgi:hypothetical protein
MRLVKAVLVAGLYPNVARVDAGGGKPGDGKKPKLTTRSADGKSGALPARNPNPVLADVRARRPCRHRGLQTCGGAAGDAAGHSTESTLHGGVRRMSLGEPRESA